MTDINVDAVIFDMDGLIIDSKPLWLQAEYKVFSSMNNKGNFNFKLKKKSGLRIDQIIDSYLNYANLSNILKEEIKSNIFNELFRLIKLYRPILPGVLDTLKLCKLHNIKIGLASASPYKVINLVLDVLKIRDYFDSIVSAEDLLYSKPNPEIYINIINKFKLLPYNCISLEDSINGMISAKSANMYSIVVPDIIFYDDPKWSLADKKLKSLKEFNLSFLKIKK